METDQICPSGSKEGIADEGNSWRENRPVSNLNVWKEIHLGIVKVTKRSPLQDLFFRLGKIMNM